MAEKIYTEPMTICLRWETEKLHVGNSRRSPEFCLLQGVWHLEMGVTFSNVAEIRLVPSFSTVPLNHDLTVVCHLEAGGKSSRQGATLRDTTKPTRVFSREMTSDETGLKFRRESAPVEKWTVRCVFQETGTCRSLSLEVGGKRVRFSSVEIEADSHPKTGDRSVRQFPDSGGEDVGVQATSEVPPDIESLSSDFSRLLEEEIFPDVKLECSGRTFRAHRSVLGARSGVFRIMFRNGMLESETGSVKIRDMDAGVLQNFLKFLYSGRPDELSEGCVSDLYAAADKYDVPSLKKACAYWTARNLTIENCAKFLKRADAHGDGDLIAAVAAFVVKNPRVMKSEAWLELSKEQPVLANEVFQAYVASTVL